MIKIETKVAIIARHSTEDGSVQVRVYPEGYACIAKDDEIALEDAYPITLELDNLDEQTLLLKAIDTIKAKKQKILDDALEEVGKLEARLVELKQLTFVE